MSTQVSFDKIKIHFENVTKKLVEFEKKLIKMKMKYYDRRRKIEEEKI